MSGWCVRCTAGPSTSTSKSLAAAASIRSGRGRPVEQSAEAAKRRPVSNCTAVVKLGRIVLAGATAGELGDGDDALQASRLTYEIRGPVRQ